MVLPSKLRTFWGQGQNEGMACYRARAVLLLFLLLNLTAWWWSNCGWFRPGSPQARLFAPAQLGAVS